MGMRRLAVLIAPLALLGLLAACGDDASTVSSGGSTSSTSTTASTTTSSTMSPDGSTTAPPTTAAPAPAAPSGGVWDSLAQCESGGNWAANTGNGFYGGLQFTLSTWHGYGGAGMPNQASREQQIAIAERVRAGQGWGAWPACSRKLGLR